MPKANNRKHKSNGTRRRSRSSPRKGATREQTNAYYLAKAHRTLKGEKFAKELAKYVRNVRKGTRKSK